VDFERAEDAQNSIETLNDTLFKDRRIIVTNFLSKKKKTEDEKFPLVTVKNLPENVFYFYKYFFIDFFK
jgi:RNA recognition motif-containing protein